MDKHDPRRDKQKTEVRDDFYFLRMFLLITHHRSLNRHRDCRANSSNYTVFKQVSEGRKGGKGLLYRNDGGFLMVLHKRNARKPLALIQYSGRRGGYKILVLEGLEISAVVCSIILIYITYN